MTPDQPDQPTNQLVQYYALRVTTPHNDSDRLWTIFGEYSKHFLYCKHAADDEDKFPHFHCVFTDLDTKGVEALRKRLKKEFGRAGNGFLSGKFMDNTVYKAIQYFRHDPEAEATFRHRGSGWSKIIEDSPDWDERREKPEAIAQSKKRERASDSVLSYYNVVKQAIKHCHEHQIKTTRLEVALEHMTRTTNWMPDIHILRRGLDPFHYRIFEYRMNGRVGQTPDWWTVRSEEFRAL